MTELLCNGKEMFTVLKLHADGRSECKAEEPSVSIDLSEAV